MHIQHQHLRMYRKRSPLLQSDVAHVLGLQDYSIVSRWEQGERRPSIDMLLAYHLLFDMPVETLFGEQKGDFSEAVTGRIKTLLEELQASSSDRKAAKRILFLELVLAKVNSTGHE